MADTTGLIAYYRGALAYQYSTRPKAAATIEALVRQALCDLVMVDVREGFSILAAVGTQLDVVGQYLGLSRVTRTEFSDRPYWYVEDYVSPIDPTIGLTDYTDALQNPDSITYRYEFVNGAFYSLQDEEYRFMLRLKLALNGLDNTFYGIRNVLREFFGSDIVAYDLADMTMGYYASMTAGRYCAIAVSQGLFPKPIGVALSGVFLVDDATKVFGFQNSAIPNGNVIGFNDYTATGNEMHFLSALDAL